MKAKYLAPILVGAMFLAGCDYSLPGEVTLPAPTEPTAIVTQAPTAIPTLVPTPTTGPQVSPTPYADFADLNAILYSDLIPNPPVFALGETPWTPDPDIYVLRVFDDGINNSVLLCNIPQGAADDGMIDLATDYPSGTRTTVSECYGGALRPSSGTPSSPTYYVIRKDGNRGTILNVALGEFFTNTLNVVYSDYVSPASLMPDCAGGVCVESHAYVLEGSLGPVASADEPVVVAQASP